MSDPSAELQKAIFTKLKADSGVTSIFGSGENARIYDEPPRGTLPAFPYISFGPAQVLPDKADCIDGTEVSVQIDIWSRKPGSVEAKQGANAVKDALDDVSLTVDGFTIVLIEHERSDHIKDPDGETFHSAVTFHVLAEAQE